MRKSCPLHHAGHPPHEKPSKGRRVKRKRLPKLLGRLQILGLQSGHVNDSYRAMLDVIV